MMRHRLTGALLAALALLLGGAGPARASKPYARVVEPAAGAELPAGSLATVAWEGVVLPRGAHEWEAFLSVDGGKTYPLRITPHLDLSIRRFTFQVPDLPTRQARLLLRFGDERREVEAEAPQRFAIVPGRTSWAPPPRRTLSPGERAREGERGVTFWTEGSREGTLLREVVSSAASLSVTGVEPARSPILPLLWPAPSRSIVRPPAAAETDLAARPQADASTERQDPASRVALRLLIHRFNE